MAVRKHSAHVLSLRGPAASSSPVLDTVSGYATAIDDPLPALFLDVRRHSMDTGRLHACHAYQLRLVCQFTFKQLSLSSPSTISHQSTGDTGPRCHDTV
jgi:hypothetical protein